MSKLSRRNLLKMGVGIAGLSLASAPLGGVAQSLSSRPIRIQVGMGAGGATDSVARLYAEKLAQVLGTPVVVENKPGAFQAQAINAIKTAAPDGQVLYMATGSALSLFPAIRTDMPYDPMKDFSFVGLAGISSAVFTVNPDLPVHTLSELVAYSKENPGVINYGSAGVGSANHIKNEYLKSVSGLQAEHIPYKSDLDILIQIASGALHLGLTTIQSAMPLIADKRVRAIAVTAPQELSYLPGVPGTAALDIQGLEALEPYSYFGLVGPVGMSPERVAELNAAINQVSSMPDVQQRMRETLFTEPFVGSPEEFREMNQRELARNTEMGKRLALEF